MNDVSQWHATFHLLDGVFYMRMVNDDHPEDGAVWFSSQPGSSQWNISSPKLKLEEAYKERLQ